MLRVPHLTHVKRVMSTMQAIVLQKPIAGQSRADKYDPATLQTVPVPVPKQGEALIRLKASALNHRVRLEFIVFLVDGFAALERRTRDLARSRRSRASSPGRLVSHLYETR